MARDINRDGGPAFPGEDENQYWHGMSLRDYFAGQAMIAVSRVWMGSIGDFDADAARRSARAAYDFADAMLEARK